MPLPSPSQRSYTELRAGWDWTRGLFVKQAIQYLDLLRREQLPSHLLPEEVPPTVTVPIGQRRVLHPCGVGERERDSEMGEER